MYGGKDGGVCGGGSQMKRGGSRRDLQGGNQLLSNRC